MTAIDLRALAPGAAEVTDLADLASILEPDRHLTTWRRPLDPAVQALASRLAGDLGRDARAVVRCSEVDLRAEVADLLPESAWRIDPEAAAAWQDDVVELCEAFAELVQADELMISLEGPDEATCPRFHVDRVGIRMLVTYSGPGTEWLAECDVDRRFLGEPGQDRPDDQNGVMKRGAVVRSVEPFSVTLLKGEAWPNAEGFGAVHRSPDPAGAARVLLRVDMLSQLGGGDQEAGR
ncbi:MAG: DUF1826 domain-containing protein [Planctomycetota bacterium]